jgi:putative transposase
MTQMRNTTAALLIFTYKSSNEGIVKLMHLAAITRQKGVRRDLRSSFMRPQLRGYPSRLCCGGVPIGLAVEGANRNDFKMARETIESIPIERPEPAPNMPQGMCLDKGYDYDEVRDLLTEFGFTAHIRARNEEAKALKQAAGSKARRWVVERTHSWMNRFRRVLIRWDKKVRNYLAFLHLACAYITYRQSGLVG